MHSKSPNLYSDCHCLCFGAEKRMFSDFPKNRCSCFRNSMTRYFGSCRLCSLKWLRCLLAGEFGYPWMMAAYWWHQKTRYPFAVRKSYFGIGWSYSEESLYHEALRQDLELVQISAGCGCSPWFRSSFAPCGFAPFGILQRIPRRSFLDSLSFGDLPAIPGICRCGHYSTANAFLDFELLYGLCKLWILQVLQLSNSTSLSDFIQRFSRFSQILGTQTLWSYLDHLLLKSEFRYILLQLGWILDLVSS